MNPLEESDLPLERKLADALARISVAMRADNWDWFGKEGLSPTQGQILLLLKSRQAPMRLSEVASELAVTAATVSDSVATLAEKELIQKEKATDDGRALALKLALKGKQLLNLYDKELTVIQLVVARLPQPEQIALYRSLLRIIRELQVTGKIPIARMCVTCRYFRPNVHKNSEQPHHCALVNAPLGDRTLRNDCPEHDAADAHLAEQNWRSFTNS